MLYSMILKYSYIGSYSCTFIMIQNIKICFIKVFIEINFHRNELERKKICKYSHSWINSPYPMHLK